ncbi:MAG: bacteriohemerythrin [Gammaproteobacteria bacterium]|nr:bacteriohemerythrin [Gammaproteobacteria bacterium]
MSLIEWKDSFSVGVPAVDHEHRELIALINRVHDNLVSGGSRDDVRQFVAELSARISAHFALEERIMREARYDQYKEHKQDHEALLDEIAEIADDIHTDAAALGDRLSTRLEAWFSEHFRTHDARLHRRLG